MSVSPLQLAAALVCAAVVNIIHRSRAEARREARAQRIETRIDALTSVVLLTHAGPALRTVGPEEGPTGGGRRPVVPEDA
jgi:hypothetical protein